MAKKKTTSTRKKAGRDAPRFPWLDLDWVRVRRGTVAVGWVVAVLGFIVAWNMGVPRLEQRAEAVAIDAELDVRFLDPPAWMNGELEAVLDLAVRQHLSTAAFQQHELAAAQKALLETGWFDEVRQVRRVKAHRVEVDAEFVKPFALIRGAAKGNSATDDYLVDPTGKRLPRSYPAGGKPGFIVIVGSRFPPPSAVGEQWDGTDVTDGLRLLRLFNDHPWRHQIASIDVSQSMDDRSLSLVTNRGCRILWGRAPGDEAGLEVEADRKLTYLDFNFAEHGHIDRGYTSTMDITGDIVTVR